jgi:hypothetical protein
VKARSPGTRALISPASTLLCKISATVQTVAVAVAVAVVVVVVVVVLAVAAVRPKPTSFALSVTLRRSQALLLQADPSAAPSPETRNLRRLEAHWISEQ